MKLRCLLAIVPCLLVGLGACTLSGVDDPVGGAGGTGGTGAIGGTAGIAGTAGNAGTGGTTTCEPSEPDAAGACDVCAAEKCCAQIKACQDDTGDPEVGANVKCWDVITCAMSASCDAGSVETCLQQCAGGAYPPATKDLYNCVYIDKCSDACASN